MGVLLDTKEGQGIVVEETVKKGTAPLTSASSDAQI